MSNGYISLQDSYNIYLQCAKTIPGFIEGTKEDCNDITKLANDYCDADKKGDELKKSQCFSALMCRYWYMITVLKKKNGNAPIDDATVLDWISDGLLFGFQYRRWRDRKNKLYKKKNGPEIVFNRCIDTMRLKWYYKQNKEKRKQGLVHISLDSGLDELENDSTKSSYGYHIGNAYKNLTNEIHQENKENLNLSLLVQQLLDNNSIFEAIVVDNVCYSDVFTNSKLTSHFSKTKLYKKLTSLNNTYRDYFINTYQVSDVRLLDKVIMNLHSLAPRYLNIRLERALTYLKKVVQ